MIQIYRHMIFSQANSVDPAQTLNYLLSAYTRDMAMQKRIKYMRDSFDCGGVVMAEMASWKHAYINTDPLKPHFYTVKLGFTGVYIIFLISAQNIDCGYSLEPPRRGGSNDYLQSMFRAEILKISEFFIWKFSVFRAEIFYIFE